MGDSETLQFYDDDYLFFAVEMANGERTENELEFIWQALQLHPGKSVLDLGCGHGRIANGLAKRSATVTGIDIVASYLDRARADAAAAGLHVNYRQADMRQLANIGLFDAALFWFFSFGYLNDDENIEVLRAVSRVIKPGGYLLLDQYNVTALAREKGGYTVLDLGDSLLMQRTICDLEACRWGAERIVVRDGAIRRSRFLCRSYTPAELTSILTEAGFARPVFLGDGFQPLGLDSTKQIMIARKRL